MHVPFVVCYMPYVVDYLFKLPICAVGSKGLFLILCVSKSKSKENIVVMQRLKPKSYNKPFVLNVPWISTLGANDPVSGTPFCQSRLLITTFQPCSLPFNVQVMILVESLWLFYLTSSSGDGCYLYIIIHCGMSWRDWRIRSAPGMVGLNLLKQQTAMQAS